MGGCKKPLGEGQQLPLPEVWSPSAPLEWEMQWEKAVQIHGGKSELQGYICVFRCGGEAGTMSAHSYGHHWDNWCFS